jgi:hypothetical protein
VACCAQYRLSAAARQLREDQGAIYGRAPDVGGPAGGDAAGMLKIASHNRRFIRHYVEMVVAMFAGMIILGIPGEAALRALGTSTSELREDAPAVVLLGMATMMTVPMVAWMRRMGHGWQPCGEMAASMFLPTFLVIAMMAVDVSGFAMAMTLEHVLMLPAMLVAMLLRREEYSCDHRHHAPAAATA